MHLCPTGQRQTRLWPARAAEKYADPGKPARLTNWELARSDYFQAITVVGALDLVLEDNQSPRADKRILLEAK